MLRVLCSFFCGIYTFFGFSVGFEENNKYAKRVLYYVAMEYADVVAFTFAT